MNLAISIVFYYVPLCLLIFYIHIIYYVTVPTCCHEPYPIAEFTPPTLAAAPNRCHKAPPSRGDALTRRRPHQMPLSCAAAARLHGDVLITISNHGQAGVVVVTSRHWYYPLPRAAAASSRRLDPFPRGP